MKLTSLALQHGLLQFPCFLPDATFGVVRSLDAQDLEACGVDAVVMNTFHLMQKPGSTAIQSLGGLHRMSGWDHPIVTDSGGFQAYSLVRQNPRFGSLHAGGITFTPEGSSRKYQLTPQKSIQLQLAYGSDVVICLDDCTHAEEDRSAQRESVERTIAWAKKCRREFDRLLDQKQLEDAQRPLLFAVVQGGDRRELRQRCADALLEIGFDGFGFGGWPLDREKALLVDIIGYTRELIPLQFPMHALGIGHPENVLACHQLGYQIFDSAMPTRDARHGRLYVFNHGSDESSAGLGGSWFSYLYIGDEKHIRANSSIDPHCDCHCCRRYSLGYLHHLFKQGDALFKRLATMHNLRFMVNLTARIRRMAGDG